MASQGIGYIRVSSLDQNAERQLDGIRLDKIFTARHRARIQTCRNSRLPYITFLLEIHSSSIP
jgi:hypothetical protein